MNLEEAILGRRTHKNFNGQPISTEVIDELLRYAVSAPNHKRNEPWRFVVVGHESLDRFLEAISTKENFVKAFPGKDEDFIQGKKQNLEKKLPDLGALIYVTCLKDPSPVVERENYAACSCAIQNLMLMATSKGLGSFWNTGGIYSTEESMAILGRNPDLEFFVGVIWLGHPTDHPPSPNFTTDSKVTYW